MMPSFAILLADGAIDKLLCVVLMCHGFTLGAMVIVLSKICWPLLGCLLTLF